MFRWKEVGHHLYLMTLTKRLVGTPTPTRSLTHENCTLSVSKMGESRATLSRVVWRWLVRKIPNLGRWPRSLFPSFPQRGIPVRSTRTSLILCRCPLGSSHHGNT